MENESADGIYELTVPEKTIYNVSNHIFYNYGSGPGGVLVQNDKTRNTTIASGYYLITGLPKGAYDPSISKAVLGTDYNGYLDVTINSTNNPIINTTCSIMYSTNTGLRCDTLFQYEVRDNNSYNNWGQNLLILSVRTAPQ